jgi:hypothetical protein
MKNSGRKLQMLDIVFVPDKPFQPRLLFPSKARAYPIEVLALHYSLTHRLERLFMENILAFYEHR